MWRERSSETSMDFYGTAQSYIPGYSTLQRREETISLTLCRRGLLEKLSGAHLIKAFPAFYGTRRFIILHKSSPQSQSQTTKIKFTSSHCSKQQQTNKIRAEFKQSFKRIIFCVVFEVLSAVNIKITVFWDVTPCNLANRYQYFGGTCCFHHL
jgi:ABC-type multidrug transport system fused ATPase/permease subunit